MLAEIENRVKTGYTTIVLLDRSVSVAILGLYGRQVTSLLFGETKMIKLNLQEVATKLNLTEDEKKIVALAFKTKKGETISELRRSKPNLKESIYEMRGGKYRISDNHAGKAAYLWRMLAYYTCNEHPYVCMPIMIDCDLPIRLDDETRHEKRKQMMDELNILVDKVLECVPKNEWKGVIRWGRALGSI